MCLSFPIYLGVGLYIITSKPLTHTPSDDSPTSQEGHWMIPRYAKPKAVNAPFLAEEKPAVPGQHEDTFLKWLQWIPWKSKD